jgi:hypothetical protein
MLSRASQAFDAEGVLVDETARKQLQRFVTDFAAFAAVKGR